MPFSRFFAVLCQIDRSLRARGVGHTLKLALKVLWKEGPRGVQRRLDALGPALRPAAAQGPRSILILTTAHTLHFAMRLADILTSAGFQAELSDSDRDVKGFGLVIAFAPHEFPDLPLDRSIAFQVEPFAIRNRWTPEYIDRLTKFRAVFDYSTSNVEQLRRHLPLSKLYHVPFAPLPAPEPNPKRRGVLFYGDVSSPRRRRMLEILRAKVPELETQTNLFGPPLWEKLRRTALVVNLHAVDGAALETARISEAIGEGAVVVSETAPDQEDYPDLADQMVFVSEGDTEAIADNLRRLIDHPEQLSALQSKLATTLPDRFRHGVLRAFQGLELITPEEFEKLVTDYPLPFEGQPMEFPRICLTLPETPVRGRMFRQSHHGYRVWPGLKAVPGWRGCALSYRHMFRSLSRANVKEVLIVEDDVILPDDFEHRLMLARKIMDEQNADLFSGLIVDLHPDPKILDVQEVEGITFVTLDRAVMMICNLYRHRMIEWLKEWDDSDRNAFTNTIDRYMEQATHMRVVTTLPFTASYQRGAHSTLRESGNDQFDELLARSTERLEAKVAKFRSA